MKKKLKNKSNKWMIGILITVFLLGGIVTYGIQAEAQVVDFLPDWITDKIDRLIELERQDATGETIIEVQSFGAVASPSLPSPYWEFGGVTHYAGRDDTLAIATTTFCAFRSPNATSTLVSAAIYFDISSTSEMFLEIAKSEGQSDSVTQSGTPNASTTLITSYRVGANAKGLFTASTTRADVNPTSITFDAKQASTTGRAAGILDESTNDWLIFKAYASTTDATQIPNGTFSPVGHCQVEWLVN